MRMPQASDDARADASTADVSTAGSPAYVLPADVSTASTSAYVLPADASSAVWTDASAGTARGAAQCTASGTRTDAP